MKPTEIVKVKGCRDCEFIIDNEYGNVECRKGGHINESIFGKDDPYYRASDCPLLTKNIQVELEK